MIEVSYEKKNYFTNWFNILTYFFLFCFINLLFLQYDDIS